MNVLGVRVSPKVIYFSVCNSIEEEIINVEKIIVPQMLIVPEKLKYIRNNILDLLREYNIQKAGIRICESNSKNIDIERLYLEGVIQETFASSQVEGYKTLRLSGIASYFGTKAAELKKYIEKKHNDTGIEIDVSNFSKEQIEAILVAIVAAN